MEYDREKAMPYNINCQTCAPAYALRLKGFDITAKGNVPGSKLEYLSKGRAFEVWKNADGTTAQHTSINDWLYTKGYLKMTAGSGMEWKDVKYLCEMGAATSHSCRGIMRIDNKLFNLDFFDIFDI